MSAEERFDIVDLRDRVVGTATRADAHALGLRHRAVHMLVFNHLGELFIQQRSAAKDTSPGLWDTSAAGHVDNGEDYDRAAIRELEEELGLSGPRCEKLFKLPASELTGHEFVWVYRCYTKQSLILDPVEIADGRWLSLIDIGTWIEREPSQFTRTFREIYARLV